MEMKHGAVYCCRRLRLLEHLLDKGFEPYATVPEPENYKYKNWLFNNSPELESVITEYFNSKKLQ